CGSEGGILAAPFGMQVKVLPHADKCFRSRIDSPCRGSLLVGLSFCVDVDCPLRPFSVFAEPCEPFHRPVCRSGTAKLLVVTRLAFVGCIAVPVDEAIGNV